MSRRLLRILGALLVLAGLAILLFALYSYARQRQLEAELEARVPGQPLSPSPTAVVLMPSFDGDLNTTANSAVETSEGTGHGAQATSSAVTVTPVATDAPSTATPTAISLAPRPAGSNEDEFMNPFRFPTRPVPTAVALLVPTGTPTTALSLGRSLGYPRGQGPQAVRLIIPKLNMDLEIRRSDYVTFEQNGQLVTDWNVPYDAAGHLATTAQPGEIGNAVISGHHNLVGPNQFGLGKFAGLWNLAVEDEIRVQTSDGKTQVWRVIQSYPLKEGGEPLSVRVQHAQQVMGDTSVPRLTLVTCWNGKDNPLSGNTYRWVIVSELVNIY